MSFKHRWSYLFIFLCLSAIIFTSCGSAGSSTTAIPNSGAARLVSSGTLDAPDPNLAKVQRLMKTMTLDQKIGQMLMIEYNTADPTASVDAYGVPTASVPFENTDLATLFSKYYVGNFLIQEVNGNTAPPYYNTPTLFKTNLIDKIQASAKLPVLTAIDQEGGLVQKLEGLYGPNTPSAADMAATQDTQKVKAYATTVTQWMKQTGINADLAPVVDVGNTEPNSDLMTTRMFSNDPQQVATYAGAFIDGLQQNGIIGTLKHFPGLGTVSGNYDPHKTLPEVTSSLQTLQSNDFIPYKKLIQQSHPAMIMTTDVKTDALDPNNPAELSPKVLSYLRNTLGYNGVVITDGLYMGGLYPDNYGNTPTSDQLAQVTVQAIMAGNDILEGDSSISNVVAIQTAIKQAIQNGLLTEARIDQSVQRILLMKYQYGIIK
jgi:Beta-glucosidase-related glycosidases